MALFTSIDQVSKPTTANFKTPIKQYDVEYHNEEFPYIIINNVFDTEEKKRLIWEDKFDQEQKKKEEELIRKFYSNENDNNFKVNENENTSETKSPKED